MKYLCLLLVFTCALFVRLDRYFFKTNDSFCPKFISPVWSRCPQLETRASLDSKILDQPFEYLTKGEQSFIFLSADRKWVLKFPRLPRSVRSVFRKAGYSKKFEAFLKNGNLVCEELENETGLVYAHLKPSREFGEISLRDRYGHKHVLSLNNLPFFVQRYGEEYFLAFNKLEDPRALIRKTIDLFNSLYDKGFIDQDPILDKNFGVVDGNPFIIDTGQLEKSEALPGREEYLRQMMESLEGFLSRESPKLHEFYKNCLH